MYIYSLMKVFYNWKYVLDFLNEILYKSTNHYLNIETCVWNIFVLESSAWFEMWIQ